MAKAVGGILFGLKFSAQFHMVDGDAVAKAKVPANTIWRFFEPDFLVVCILTSVCCYCGDYSCAIQGVGGRA